MKKIYSSMLFLVLSFLFVKNVHSQKDTIESEPFYIVVRTLHGVEGSDINEWKEVAEEYFNKVVSKNDLIVSHEVLLSYFSSNLNEIKLINVYKSWEDIQNSVDVRDKLIQQAWPDEKERKYFFEKQQLLVFDTLEVWQTSNLMSFCNSSLV